MRISEHGWYAPLIFPTNPFIAGLVLKSRCAIYAAFAATQAASAIGLFFLQSPDWKLEGLDPVTSPVFLSQPAENFALEY